MRFFRLCVSVHVHARCSPLVLVLLLAVSTRGFCWLTLVCLTWCPGLSRTWCRHLRTMGPCLSAALADIPSYFQTFFPGVWSEQCSAQHCRPLLLVLAVVVLFLWMRLLVGCRSHSHVHIGRGPSRPKVIMLAQHACIASLMTSWPCYFGSSTAVHAALFILSSFSSCAHCMGFGLEGISWKMAVFWCLVLIRLVLVLL